MHWSRTVFLALPLSLLLGVAAADAASRAPVVREVEDRGEIDQIKCDGMEDADVNVGDTINFYVSFTASNSAKAQVTGVHYWFWADDDYNEGDPGVTLRRRRSSRTATASSTTRP